MSIEYAVQEVFSAFLERGYSIAVASKPATKAGSDKQLLFSYESTTVTRVELSKWALESDENLHVYLTNIRKLLFSYLH